MLEKTKTHILRTLDNSIRECANCIKQLDNYPNDPNLIEGIFNAQKNYKIARSIYINSGMGTVNLFPGNILENPQSKEEFDKRMLYLKQMEELNLAGAYHNSI